VDDRGKGAAVVTGAGSGVGRAVAVELAKLGMRVGLMGRDRGKLEETAALIGGEPSRVWMEAVDVGDREGVEQAVGRIEEGFGTIDVLVCNAGVNVPKRALAELEPADWDRMLRTNLTGAFYLVRAVLPGMRRRRSGLVVQICSISGKRASVLGGVGYSASKFGQAALGICLGREERVHGIRSTVIYPGEINTPILDRRPVAVPAERRAAILQPEDVAAAVRFVVELPARANVPELVMTPTVDEWF
jgi:NADP-dependent 3-hydroxy acid dehydrogenase YdfG